MNKNKLTIWILVIAVLVIGGVMLFRGGDEERLSKEESQALAGDEIKVVGELKCLELKDESDDGCVVGLVADNGVIYALNSTKVKAAELRLGPNTPVEAIGVFEPADTKNQESSVFVYDGVLVLSSLKEIK